MRKFTNHLRVPKMRGTVPKGQNRWLADTKRLISKGSKNKPICRDGVPSTFQLLYLISGCFGGGQTPLQVAQKMGILTRRIGTRHGQIRLVNKHGDCCCPLRIGLCDPFQMVFLWVTRWWFQIFFIFTPTWGRFPI